VAKLRDGMGELDFYRVLAPVVAAARCGHTGLFFSPRTDALLRARARYFPLRVCFIGEHLFVVDPLKVEGIPAGAEISAINGRSAREILGVLLKGISADGRNLTKKYCIMGSYFADVYLALVESPERFTIGFVDPVDGRAGSVEAEGISKSAVQGPPRPLPLPYSISFDAPGVAALTVRTFVLYSGALERYKAFLEESFTSLRERGVSTLILDLRDNLGGDPGASSLLYRYLIREPSPYFPEGTPYYVALTRPLAPAANAFQGKLLVLTNGLSFSSTGHLCSLLRFHGLAVFIGEETGGTFSCTDGSRDIPLSASGFILRCSTREFHAAVTGMEAGRGILPDYPITPSLADLVSGRDAQKDFALALASRGN
jgi:hypothetical protein